MKGVSGRRIPSGVPLNVRKLDRDEDLLLFKELHKREKDRVASLLQPVSDEFEPSSGNHNLYRIASGRKGPGYEIFGNNDKNDYDWLKTPPATPLFPSLEMEANAPELAVQKEIPIMQPLSRFAGNSSTAKGITGRPKSPNHNPNLKTPPIPVTPNQRSTTIPSIDTKNINTIPALNRKMASLATELDQRKNTLKPAPTTNQQESQTSFLTTNLSKNTSQEAKKNPRTRGISPSVRPTIPSQIPGFSNDAPPKLRTTNRATSAARGRPVGTGNTTPQPSQPIKAEINARAKSLMRGRKESSNEGNCTSELKGAKVQTGNGTQVFGSRMVEKVMNARKLGAVEKGAKSKIQGSTSGGMGSNISSFGRLMSKSSLDTTLKHMQTLEIKRDRNNLNHVGYNPGRSSTREQLR